MQAHLEMSSTDGGIRAGQAQSYIGRNIMVRSAIWVESESSNASSHSLLVSTQPRAQGFAANCIGTSRAARGCDWLNRAATGADAARRRSRLLENVVPAHVAPDYLDAEFEPAGRSFLKLPASRG